MVDADQEYAGRMEDYEKWVARLSKNKPVPAAPVEKAGLDPYRLAEEIEEYIEIRFHEGEWLPEVRQDLRDALGRLIRRHMEAIWER